MAQLDALIMYGSQWKKHQKSIFPHILYSLDHLFHLCVCVTQLDICQQKTDLSCCVIQ